MEIKWILAYFLFSVLLVLGDAQQSNGPANPKRSTGPKKPASPKAAPTKVNQAVQKNTAASTPTTPSTDPEICELKKNGSDFALPSLLCTLKNLPEEIAQKWKEHMTSHSKNESGLLQEICEAKENNEDPDFMKAYSPDDKGMVTDTSVLCRIRHTTPSECTVLQGVDA
uniref:Putative isac anti-complement n=1 Tax=Ixodes ricinus TaxID=34613 RepID=A0A0K8R355_IXORI